MILNRNCPVCDHSFGKKLHSLGFGQYDEQFLPNSYDIVFCEKCGFVFADTVAQEKDYDLYYEKASKYQDEVIASGGVSSEWDQLRWESIIKLFIDIGIKFDDPILDIGCAQGGSLINLRKAGFLNLTGMDLCLECIEKIKQKGFHGYFGSIQSITHQFNRKFKLIILSHILEHILNVDKSIGNLENVLDEDGIVYIEVPDAARYIDYYSVPFHFYDQEHINHFTINSLSNLMKLNGYQLIMGGHKEINASSNKMTPALYGLFKKHYDLFENKDVLFDEEALLSHHNYIEYSRLQSKWPLIEELISTKEEIIVWGAGSYTLRLLANTPLKETNIIAFIDNDRVKQGNKLNNIKIHSPEFLISNHHIILVCSAYKANEILNEIRLMKIENPVHVI